MLRQEQFLLPKQTMSSGAPREQGIPIRYPSTALFCVNTNDGFNRLPVSNAIIEGPDPADMTINLQRTLMAGYMTRLTLTEAQIQWNIPNVNRLNNNITLQIFDPAGVSQFYTRPTVNYFSGWRSAPQIIKDLETGINTNAAISNYFTAAGCFQPYFEVFLANDIGNAVITSSIPAPVSDVTITTSQPRVCIKLRSVPNVFGGVLPSVAGLFNIVSSGASGNLTGLPSLQDDLTTMLGLQATNAGSGKFITIYGGYASFQYTPYIDIISRTLCKNQTITDSDTSPNSVPQKLARIYLNNEAIVPFYASATYQSGTGDMIASDDNVIGSEPFTFRREFSFPKQIQWNTTQNIDYVQLQLVDAKGNTLPIENNSSTNGNVKTSLDLAEYQFTLQVSEV